MLVTILSLKATIQRLKVEADDARKAVVELEQGTDKLESENRFV